MRVKEYFSHDYHARIDPKLKKVRKAHKMEGVGIYWCIVEMLYEQGGKIAIADMELIADELKSELGVIESVINDFELFRKKGKNFYSIGVNNRLEERSSRSKKGKESADARWNDGKEDSRIKAKECIFYILKIYDENEQFIKVGITSESIARRYNGKLNGYSYEIVHQCEDSVAKCLQMEREILAKYENYSPSRKFAGSLECLNISGIQEIVDFAMHDNEFRNANKVKDSKVNKIKVKDSKVKQSHPAHAELYSDFLLKFNQVTGKNFGPDKKSEKQFSELMIENKTSEQILLAVKNCLSDQYHKDNPNYLTPEFITRKEKFNRFINYVPVKANTAGYPNGYDRRFENSLPDKDKPKYWNHLRENCNLEPKRNGRNEVIDWVPKNMKIA